MASLNLCQFIGNVGQDPDIKYTASGDAVANISLACNETWKDKEGNKQEHTEWVRCVAFGRKAELIGEYIKKGSPLYIQGRQRTRKWQDQNGQDRWTTEVAIDRMQFLGMKSGDGAGQHRAEEQAQQYQPPQNQQGQQGPSNFDDFDDDIPFAPAYRGMELMV